MERLAPDNYNVPIVGPDAILLLLSANADNTEDLQAVMLVSSRRKI